MTPLFPFHTPSKSLADRVYAAEFDDALADQISWKNVRYEGSKIKTKEINKFTPQQTASAALTGVGFASIVVLGATIGEMVVGPNGGVATTISTLSTPGSTIENGFLIEGYTAAGTGMGQSTFTVGGYFSDPESENPDLTGLPGIFSVEGMNPPITYEGDSENPLGLIPNLKNETTALYIASSVKGGTEDDQFTTIKNHSYLSIDQILLINPRTDELQIIEKQSENFTPFHTFITNDLPTGGNFSVRLIEEFISHNLKGPNQYKVKMNKGWLLKTFDFHFDSIAPQLTENNSMYLYKSGSVAENLLTEGASQQTDYNDGTLARVANNARIRFNYGIIELIDGNQTGPIHNGHHLQRENIGPSFKASSIIENTFTQQYYSGSFGLINEPSLPGSLVFNTDMVKSSGLGSASRFIGLDTLNFLRTNNLDTTLTEQEKTELHITFFQGTKDFAPGFNDERSIGTFEVDKNQEQLNVGGVCHDFLPKNHELILKGNEDTRFEPTFTPYLDSFVSGYVTASADAGNGCVQINQLTPQLASTRLQLGLNVDQTLNAEIFVQGGIIGQEGFISYQSASDSSYGRSNLTHELGPLFGSPSASDNFYSGSFQYQLSWLDKDHVIITNLDKDAELFDGIGNEGVIIIPEHIHPKIKNNLNYYLQQAGIGGGKAPNTLTQLDSDSK